MDLSSLRKPLSEMTEEELQQVIIDMRSRRRTSAQPKPAKKPALKGHTREELLSILELLGEDEDE